MKKVLYLFSVGIIAAFGLCACGSDKPEKEEENKVYLVKSVTSLNEEEGDFTKTNFTYSNGKLTKVTYVSGGESYTESFSYLENTVTIKDSDGDEQNIILDNSGKAISEWHSLWYSGDGTMHSYDYTYSYDLGFLTKRKCSSRNSYGEGEDDVYYYSWTNGNMTKLIDELGERTISYSDIKNNTNIDFMLWMWEETEVSSFAQFIKNVSKNIPSKLTTEDGSVKITTTLDEKGRPAKIEYGEYNTFSFEYYD